MTTTFAIRHAEAEDGHSVFILTGSLDARHAGSLRDVLKQAIDSGAVRLRINMADVPFVDSAGLAALVFGLKLARRAGGDVVLTGVQPQTFTLLSLTMLDKVFSIDRGREAAFDEPVHNRSQQP